MPEEQSTPRPKPQYKTVQLTPEMAEKYLSKNTGNRNIRARNVAQYARDMRNGKWLESGEPIQFDWNGRLMNGQHRCLAVIESGVTITVLVVTGLPPEVREVIDTGAKRTGADALRFAGFDHSPETLAAVARIAEARANGFLRTAMASTFPAITNSEVIQWAEDNPGVEHALALARSTYKNIQIAPASWAYCLYEIEKVDAAFVAEFATSTSDMVGFVGRDDPRKVFLEIFQRAARGERRRPIVAESIYIVYRAWNAWALGERLSLIKVGNAGTAGFDIPKLVRRKRS